MKACTSRLACLNYTAVTLAVMMTLASFPVMGQETNTLSEADKVWADTEAALEPPVPPAEWRERRPSQEEVEGFRSQQGKLAVVAAERAKGFYTQYPEHEKADVAREKEFEMVQIAVQLGNVVAAERLGELESERLDDPNLSEDERFKLRVAAVQREASEGNEEDRDALMEAYTKGARELHQEFPDRDEPLQILLSLAGNLEADEAKAVAQEVLDANPSEKVRDAATGMLKQYDALGKPLNIEFTALDGREIDLTAMEGKVVLVDFWATWCGPCVAELPKVKQVYDDLHGKGFEIVGISFDRDQSKLEEFLEKEGMSWPQYYDGLTWDNKLGREYGIQSIPTMWLLNKEGHLVDMSARNNLRDKVEKLLAE